MNIDEVKIYVLVFFIYAFAGWIMETTSISIRNKKFVNRGFFNWACLSNIWIWSSISKLVITKISK